MKNNYKDMVNDYQNRISEDQAISLLKFCKKYGVEPVICAWYEDWEDFCSDWCDYIGYSRTEARAKLHGGVGEFKIFSDGTICRIEM